MVRARWRDLGEGVPLDLTQPPSRGAVAADRPGIRPRCPALAPTLRWLESTSRLVDQRRADLAGGARQPARSDPHASAPTISGPCSAMVALRPVEMRSAAASRHRPPESQNAAR